MADKRSLIGVLKAELEFLNRGGYQKTSWRPQFVFEDSPTCLNYGRGQDQRACSECVLMALVPPEKREEKVPCRYIQLNEHGDTVDSLYRSGTQEELESALKDWLTHEIERLETRATPGDVESGISDSLVAKEPGDDFKMRKH